MTCTVNGQLVTCPEFLQNFGPLIFTILPITIFALFVLTMAGLWKVFKKANKPGWAAIIPIYNFVIILQIVKRPIWWIILFFIPFVNFVVMIIVMVELAKCFGRSAGFGIGLALLNFIFLPILGFSSSQYTEPQDRQNVIV